MKKTVKVLKSAKKELKSPNFRIEGGKRLSGEIIVRTSKNGALGVMCASLINKNITTIKNVPKIEEVFRIAEILESIGVKIEWSRNDMIITPPKKILIEKINEQVADQMNKTRGGIMFIGPLIHKFNNFKIPQPAGCKLGSRTVKPYFYALDKMGIKIETESDCYKVSHKGLNASEIILYEAGDTVTETVLMVAAGIDGKTVIKFASANYQVQDVCYYLQLLGIKIEGIGTSTLTVYGKKEIDIPVEYALSEDPIEAMSLIATAIVTRSSNYKEMFY